MYTHGFGGGGCGCDGDARGGARGGSFLAPMSRSACVMGSDGSTRAAFAACSRRRSLSYASLRLRSSSAFNFRARSSACACAQMRRNKHPTR